MGSGIAQVMAAASFEVALHDITDARTDEDRMD
jgi:3-hydroxyacyl-CoA dehydrogenase